MANLTLKIDDNTLGKACELASRRETSINAIVRRSLEEFISSDLSLRAAVSGLDAFYSRCKARIGDNNWTRNETMKNKYFLDNNEKFRISFWDALIIQAA